MAEREQSPTLDVLAGALDRLARSWEPEPPRVELSRPEGRRWYAQIVADALRRPLVGFARTPAGALEDLAAQVAEYDWRRVKR